MKHILSFLGIFIILISFWQCQSEITPRPELVGLNFIQLEKGRYIDYEITEIRFFVVEDPETLYYQLREIVADTFTDLEGETAYRLERYTRNQTGEIWQIDSVWTATVNQARYIKTENNIPYIRLAFPIAEEKVWNGNALNSLPEENYQITGVGDTTTIGRFDFRNTFKVIQANDSNLVFLKKSEEFYAENIGLIKKNFTFIQYCNESDCLGNGEISFGNIYTQTIIDYGISTE